LVKSECSPVPFTNLSQAKLEPTGVKPVKGLHSDGRLQALSANLRKTRVDGNGSGEHSNLFRCVNNYGYKRFYSTGPNPILMSI
jgi:hypothetical protein